MKCPDCTEEIEKISPYNIYRCASCKAVFQIHSESELERIGDYALKNQNKKVSEMMHDLTEELSKGTI